MYFVGENQNLEIRFGFCTGLFVDELFNLMNASPKMFLGLNSELQKKQLTLIERPFVSIGNDKAANKPSKEKTP